MVPQLSGWHTVPGRRPANQDACLVRQLADGRSLVALADGMGGHRAGEVASRTALDALAAALEEGLPLVAACTRASREVYDAARANPQWNGMGTTLVALLRAGERYEVANIGDSRAYRIAADGVRQLTRDHTLLEEASSAGGDAAASASESRWRHALTRALGTEPEVEADLFGPFSALERHAILLCSDGLYRWLGDTALGAAANHGSADAAARMLVDAAYANGSTDNITAAVVRFGDVAVRTSTRGTASAPPLAQRSSGREVARRHRRAARNRRVLIELGVVLALLAVVLTLLVRLA